MLRSYLIAARRHLARNKVFVAINVGGLAIGMACCILILLWVRHELSYDRFHEHAGEIYRVIQHMAFAEETDWAITQGPLGPALKQEYPEIVEAVRISSFRAQLSVGEHRFHELGRFADPAFFRMFSFRLRRGSAQSALQEPASIVLGPELAARLFGAADPLGKTITIDQEYDFLVTGVLEEIPDNSSLQTDFLVPFDFARTLGYTIDGWANSGYSTFVRLAERASPVAVEEKIAHFLDTRPTSEEGTRLGLQPITAIHLGAGLQYDYRGRGDVVFVYVFSLVALFILAIACINFVNLSTARASKRAREVGIRKTVGAQKHDVIAQFFGESAGLTLIALVFAIALVELLLPVFNDLSGKELTLVELTDPAVAAGILGIVILTAIAAGSYPALLLSSFRPISVLRTSRVSGGAGRGFRRILVVAQFVLSILLIISTIVVYRQLHFMRNKDLGFQKEHIVFARLKGDMNQRYEALRNELLASPQILKVAATSNPPSLGMFFANTLWSWEGKDPAQDLLMNGLFASPSFFDTFGIKLVEGRVFSRQPEASRLSEIIINRKAARSMGMDSPIGKTIYGEGVPLNIIGVVEDYHFRTVHQEIEPLVIYNDRSAFSIVCMAIAAQNIEEAIDHGREVWRRFAPEYTFDYFFLDEMIDRQYGAEARVGAIVGHFTVLAIFVSCLGLYGLASFNAEQRTKEIGVRKVFGASVPELVLLLSRELAGWVLAANVIAWPIAFLALRRWLDGFAYRIEIGPWPFFFAAGLAFAVSMITVSLQAIRAASANPTVSLKYE